MGPPRCHFADEPWSANHRCNYARPNLIGSVKPEIGTPWGDIDAFVEIMRDLASNIPTRMLVEWSRGAEKEKNITVIRKISKSLKEIEIIFKKK